MLLLRDRSLDDLPIKEVEEGVTVLSFGLWTRNWGIINSSWVQDLQHKGVVTTTGQLPSEPMRASAHDVTPPFPLENCLSYKQRKLKTGCKLWIVLSGDKASRTSQDNLISSGQLYLYLRKTTVLRHTWKTGWNRHTYLIDGPAEL